VHVGLGIRSAHLPSPPIPATAYALNVGSNAVGQTDYKMQRYYIIEGLFILVGIAFLVTAIKYPKDVFVKLPLEIIKLPFRRLWELITFPVTILAIPIIYFGEKYKWRITPSIKKFADLGANYDDDKPYPSTRNLKVDFKNGDKYVYTLTTTKDIKLVVDEFLEVLTKKYSINDFKIIENGEQRIVQFPADINFYDFHLLVQHLNNELGDKRSFGIYKSSKLDYYVFQDSESLNNLVGFTSDKKLFSIYMLDDLEKKQHLRLNQRLKIKTDWIERVNGTTANNRFGQWRGDV